MTTLAAPSVNMAQSTLAASYTRGTDTDITLVDGTLFPSPTPLGHVILIRDTYKFTPTTKLCLVIYTSKATHVLTMGGGATDYALGKNVTVGDEAYEWPIGSYVSIVSAADEIAQEMNSAIHRDVGGEIVAITEKTAPIGADEFLIEDSEATNAKKSVKIANLPHPITVISTNTTITLGTDITDSLAAIETYLADKLVAAELTFQLTTKTYNEQLSISSIPLGSGGKIIIVGNGVGSSIIDGQTTRDYCIYVKNCTVELEDLEVQGAVLANIKCEMFSELTLSGSIKSDTCSAYGIYATSQSVINQDPACALEVNAAGTYGIWIENGSYFILNATTGTLSIHDCTNNGITAEGLSYLNVVGDSGSYSDVHIYSNGRDAFKLQNSSGGFLRYAHLGGNTRAAIYCSIQSCLNLFNVDDGAEGANGAVGGSEIYADAGSSIRYSGVGDLSIGSEGATSYSIHFAV